MLQKCAVAALLLALAQPAAAVAQADQPTNSTASAPDSALTSRFTAFFKQVLAGHAPGGNISPQMKSGLTPQLISQIDGAFASYGTFRRLDFVHQDSLQGYQRYHYTAVFDKGSQGLMFVVDSNGTIAGFFQDPGTSSGSQ
jgi:hypothetical protein